MKTVDHQCKMLKVDSSYNQINERAKQLALICLHELSLDDLACGQKLERLFERVTQLRKEKETFHYLDYLVYAGNRQALCKVYAGNLIFFHDHEEDKLFQAMVLHEKIMLLERKIDELQAEEPVFTYSRYLNSEDNLVFYLMGRQPRGTSPEDYARMKRTQAIYQSKCISSLTRKFRGNFIGQCAGKANPYNQATRELKLVRNLLDQTCQRNEEEFSGLLRSIRATGRLTGPADMAGFHAGFTATLQDPDTIESLRPADFTRCLARIEENRIPDGPVFCHALISYEGWLNDIVYQQAAVHEHPELRYEELFNSTFLKVIDQAAAQQAAFQGQYPSSSMSNDQYAAILLTRLNQLTAELDLLTEADYFQHMHHVEMLKCCFINNCLNDRQVDHHLLQLDQSLQVALMIDFLENELARIGKALKHSVEDIRKLERNTCLIIAHMVPSPAILSRMNENIARAMKAYQERKPVYAILENYSLQFRDIFLEAAENLLKLYAEKPDDQAMLYSAQVLWDIDLMEFRARADENEIDPFYKSLKKLIKIHVKRYRLISDIRAKRPKGSPGKGKIMDERCFGCMGQEEILTRIFEKINKHLNFLSPETSISHAVKVFTAPDWSVITEKVYVALPNTVFKYMIHCLKKKFPLINYSRIGQSGLFVSNQGSVFSESLLNSTDYTNVPPAIKRIIENSLA